MTRQSETERTTLTDAFEFSAGLVPARRDPPQPREAVPVAAMHTVTVTCPVCAEPITVPVMLIEVDDVDGRKRGAFTLVSVHLDRAEIRAHRCPTDDHPGRRAAA